MKKASDTFEYDAIVKDKLIKYKGSTVSYSSSNPLNIESTPYHCMEHEGKRMTYCESGAGYGYYEYNEQGLRTKKYWYGSPNITSSYYYDGDRLVTEIRDSNRLDFLYNEAGMLFGFILNNASKYFYVRDILQNILGIIDSNGNLVVKYNCDAWGNNQVITDTSGINLGTINPFRYKGYYYDDETGLFWCNSRYYNPEWGRWISPDSIEYLDPSSINGLNLYAYCANNPIMYSDPSGHMPEWAQWIVGGLAIAGLAVATALTFGAAGAGAVAVGAAMLAGGVISGGINIVDQLHDNGSIDWTEAAISTLSGTAYGLVVGLTGGTGGWAVAGKFAVAGGTSLLNSWNQDSTPDKMLGDLALSLVLSGVAQGAGYLAGKFGPQLVSKIIPRNPNHLITMGDIASVAWSIPAIKAGTMRLLGGVFGSIFNDIF